MLRTIYLAQLHVSDNLTYFVFEKIDGRSFFE